MARFTLKDLGRYEEGILESIDLPEWDARRFMELGFLPGVVVSAAGQSPFGDPRVYRVDGSEVALRSETASRLILRGSGSASRKDP